MNKNKIIHKKESVLKPEKLRRKKWFTALLVTVPILIVGAVIGIVLAFAGKVSYTITVTQSEHGQITTQLSDESFAAGSDVTYTITPSTGYEIATITVDGASVPVTAASGAAQTYTFTNIQATHSITATFAIRTFGITVTQSANGTITPTTSVKNYGDSQTFTIAPNIGYKIATITVDGSSVAVIADQGDSQIYTFNNVQATHTIAATFVVRTFLVRFEDGSGNEIVTRTVEYGQDATPPADPEKTGYTFSGWAGSYTNIQSNETLTAQYDVDMYSVTFKDHDGTTLRTESVAYGSFAIGPTTNPTRAQNAQYAYAFSSWYVGVTEISDISSYAITGETTFTAHYTPTVRKYSVTVTQPGYGGSISPTTVAEAEYGTEITFTLTPEDEYKVESVTVNGTVIAITNNGTAITYSITVNRITTFTATFSLTAYASSEKGFIYTGDDSSTLIVIPGIINGENVTNFDFSSLPDATETILIPDTLTDVDLDGLAGLRGLSEITVNDGNENFSSEDGALYDADGQTLIYVPSAKEEIEFATTLTIIGERAFENSIMLEVILPSTIQTIGANAFSGSSIQTLGMSSSTTTLSADSLSGMNSLTEIIVTNELSASYALPEADNDGTYTYDWIIDNSVTTETLKYAGTYTISTTATGYLTAPSHTSGWTYSLYAGGEYSLTGVPIGSGSLIIPSSLVISNGTTVNMSSLSTITALTNISGYTNIVIEPGFDAINSAFWGCTSLTSITIPSSVTRIGNQAFRDCTSLTSITIPSSVTSIANEVFRGCINLTSVIIPSGVTSLGSSIFSGCTNLMNIQTNSISKATDGTDGIYIIDSNGEAVLTAGVGIVSVSGASRSLNSVVGSALTTIMIPNNITSIGAQAFLGCSSLESATIPDGVTSIGYEAFRGCTSLTSITIPSDVTNVGYSIFIGCKNLISIQTNSISKATDGTDGIYIIDSNGEVVLTAGVGIVSVSGASHVLNSVGGSLTTIIIPDNITSIGKSAFYECTSLTSITFGENSQLEIIEQESFSSCSQLKTIIIPRNVMQIHYAAFTSCSQLKTVTFYEDSNLISVGGSAFWNCALESITLPSSVMEIGDSALGANFNLETITIKSFVNYSYALLHNCTRLENIYVPSSLVNSYKAASGWSDFASKIFAIA